MALRGTDPESYITELTVYEDYLKVGSVGAGVEGQGDADGEEVCQVHSVEGAPPARERLSKPRSPNPQPHPLTHLGSHTNRIGKGGGQSAKYNL